MAAERPIRRPLILAGGGMKVGYQAGAHAGPARRGRAAFDHADGTSGRVPQPREVQSGLSGTQDRRQLARDRAVRAHVAPAGLPLPHAVAAAVDAHVRPVDPPVAGLGRRLRTDRTEPDRGYVQRLQLHRQGLRDASGHRADPGSVQGLLRPARSGSPRSRPPARRTSTGCTGRTPTSPRPWLAARTRSGSSGPWPRPPTTARGHMPGTSRSSRRSRTAGSTRSCARSKRSTRPSGPAPTPSIARSGSTSSATRRRCRSTTCCSSRPGDMSRIVDMGVRDARAYLAAQAIPFRPTGPLAPPIGLRFVETMRGAWTSGEPDPQRGWDIAGGEPTERWTSSSRSPSTTSTSSSTTPGGSGPPRDTSTARRSAGGCDRRGTFNVLDHVGPAEREMRYTTAVHRTRRRALPLRRRQACRPRRRVRRLGRHDDAVLDDPPRRHAGRRGRRQRHPRPAHPGPRPPDDDLPDHLQSRRRHLRARAAGLQPLLRRLAVAHLRPAPVSAILSGTAPGLGVRTGPGGSRRPSRGRATSRA